MRFKTLRIFRDVKNIATFLRRCMCDTEDRANVWDCAICCLFVFVKVLSQIRDSDLNVR